MNEKRNTVVVAGAGGFIGGHLVRDLLRKGFADVRAVDIKPLSEWYQRPEGVEKRVLDLKKIEDCRAAVEGCETVYNLAADMGGIGFIEGNKMACMRNVLINTHLLEAAAEAGVERYFFASSACVYAAEHQTTAENAGLKEADAYPANPEDGYGWEKLFSERMCLHYGQESDMQTRVARFHNVYGPHGTFRGGREKAPAAMCRKVIEAIQTGGHSIEIWGDGRQTRSFMYVDDCVEGIHRLMASDFPYPINLGSDEMVSINELVSIVEELAGVTLERCYLSGAPMGVRGRSSDNTLIGEVLDWVPSITLANGMAETYDWIHSEMVGRSHPQPGATTGSGGGNGNGNGKENGSLPSRILTLVDPTMPF